MKLFSIAIQRKPKFSRASRILVYVNERQDLWIFRRPNQGGTVDIVYRGTDPDTFAKQTFPSFF